MPPEKNKMGLQQPEVLFRSTVNGLQCPSKYTCWGHKTSIAHLNTQCVLTETRLVNTHIGHLQERVDFTLGDGGIDCV